MALIVYNVSLLLGTMLVGVGTWLQWGLGAGLMTVGALVLILTFLSALMARG